MDTTHTYGVLILAGGKSSRMNFPKPWLSFQGKSSILEHLVNLYADLGFRNIVVVLNHEFYAENWKHQIKKVEQESIIVKNEHVEKGRLYSIKIGLENLQKADFIFIQNIDTPFIDESVINALGSNSNLNGVTIPTFQGKGGHPVLISRQISDDIKRGYNQNETLRDILNRYGRTNIEVETDRVLMNLNTPSEYRSAMNELV